jgi:hypothetical protein
MQIFSFCNIFWLGVFGGFLGEAVKWYRLRENLYLPHYIKSPFYWIITLVIIFSGGIMTVLYGYEIKNPLLAVNIGISAPLIIQTFAQTLPHGKDDSGNLHSRDSISLVFKKITFEKLHTFLAGIK